MNDKKVVDMYNHPEKYGFKKEEYGTVKNTIKSLYPDQIFAVNDNDMVKETMDYLNSIEETPRLKSIKKWVSSLKFPENSNDANELINIAIKALRLYKIFNKDAEHAITFLKSIQVGEVKSYEELYNSFTDEERKMTDEYYNKLFNENGVSLTDEEREAIQKGANLLKDFKHPEMYKLLEKYFPK